MTKFSAVQEGRRYVVKRHGAAGSVILKLPSTRHPDLAENEYTGYRLCQALGLACAEARVISRHEADLPGDVPFDHLLAVQRFDRGPDGQRIHMEEFAQVLQYPPRQKYGHDLVDDYAAMLRVLDELSSRPVADVREFIARFIGFVLMGNTDAHLKNWALLYPDSRTPQLAPLYDPVCITAFFEGVPLADYGEKRAIDAQLRLFGWQQLEALLERARLRRVSNHVRLAKEVVRRAQSAWPALLDDAPHAVRRSVTQRLFGGLALTR